MDRSTGAKKLSCRSTFTQPGRPKLSGNAGIVTLGERGKELGVSELQNGRARARKSARGTRAERRADGTGTHLKVFGQSKLDPHKAASPMLPSCIASFSGQVPVMSRATRSSVSTTRRAINVPQPDLPGAAAELERGGWGRPLRVERRACSPHEVSSSPDTCKRMIEKINRSMRRSALPLMPKTLHFNRRGGCS